MYSFSLKLDDKGKDIALKAEAFDVWHRCMGHSSLAHQINYFDASVEIPNKVERNGLS